MLGSLSTGIADASAYLSAGRDHPGAKRNVVRVGGYVAEISTHARTQLMNLRRNFMPLRREGRSGSGSWKVIDDRPSMANG